MTMSSLLVAGISVSRYIHENKVIWMASDPQEAILKIEIIADIALAQLAVCKVIWKSFKHFTLFNPIISGIPQF